MKLCYGMSKEDWKELLQRLKNTESITLSSFAETDSDGLFVDFKYLTFEHDNQFYYMQESWDVFNGISITAYVKVNPYEKQQIAYPMKVSTFDDIIRYIHEPRRLHPLKDTHKQRIYLGDLYGLFEGTTTLWKLANKWAGFREKEILSNLGKIEMIQHTKDYKVLRFHHIDETHYFDFETKSKRITG